MTVPASLFTGTWSVTGMTCRHCVASVTEELGEIDGVADVAVELATGSGPSAVTVTSTAPLRSDDVRRAIEEAGYHLAA